MNFLKSIFFLFQFFFPISIQSIISLNISNSKLEIIIGKDENNGLYNASFFPDLTANFTFLDRNLFDNPLASINTNKKITIQTSNFKEEFEIYTDCFKETSSKLEIKNFFYGFPYERRFFSNRIPFGYKVNESSSLVHQAYNMKIIKSKVFGIKIQKDKSGAIYLGGFPDDLIANRNLMFCHINTSYNTWGCNLKGVIFFNKEYITDEYMYFDSEMTKYRMTEKFNKYFENEISSDAVNYLNQILSLRFFCLKYKIGKYVITIPESIGVKKSGRIYLNGNIDNKFSLGHLFLVNYLVKFDYTDEIISIYGDKGIEEINIVMSFGIKKTLFINGIILNMSLLFLIVFLFYCRYKFYMDETIDN